MELSKDILLLDNVLCDQHTSDELVIQLIQDICQGLDIPLSSNDEAFLKTKICFYLFGIVLNEDCELKNLSYHFPSTCNAQLTWYSLLNICIKSNILDALFALLLDNLPEETLQIMIAKYCREITQFDFNDIISSLCIITTQLMRRPNGVAAKAIHELLDAMILKFDGYNMYDVAEHHAENIKLALKPFQKSENQDVAKDLDIVVLKQLQGLSCDDAMDSANVQQQIEKLQKCIFDLDESSDDCLKVAPFLNDLCDKLILLLQKHLNGLQNTTDASSMCVENYCSCLKMYIQKMNKIIKSTENSKSQGNLNSLAPVWDLESALFCATNFLQYYDDAVRYLLARLSDSTLHSQVVNNCLENLSHANECMMRSEHVISLCKVIRSLESITPNSYSANNLQCAIDLLTSVFTLLPLRSKTLLLDKRCNNDVTEIVRGLDLHGNNLKNIKKINLVFNKMTKINVGVDFDSFLHSVCDIAFTAPFLTLQKLVDHIASHEENHGLLAKVFQFLPCLLMLENKGETNQLLSCFVEIAETHEQESTVKNICNFITLFLQSDYVDKDVENYFLKQILCFYILTTLSDGRAHKSSIDFSLSLIKCISHTFGVVDSFDLFVLAYQLARILDEASIPDSLFSRVKTTLIDVVAVLSKRIVAQEPGMDLNCNWLHHSASSLLWTTQLYLRPLLTNCPNYVTIVPDSIKSICSLPEAEQIRFDTSYGDGTGLTAWLQCLVIDPSLFSLTSLNVQQLSRDEQQLFKLGVVVALSQVLPFRLEDDWRIILEALKSLLDQNCLYVAYPLRHIKVLPFVNLEKFRSSLCILELLHQVTHMLGNDCCRSWMNMNLWTRFARCFAISVKQMLSFCSNDKEIEAFQQHMFFLSQLFFHTCDFLVSLQDVSDTENACDFLYVLLLDILTMFCTIYDSLIEASISSVCEVVSIKSHMQSSIENVKHSEMKDALLKKLMSLS